MNNHHRYLKTLSVILCLITFNSLSSQIGGLTNNVYIPEYATFDNISSKGDISLQIASGALSDTDFPSFRLSYGAYKNFTVGLNFFSFGSSSPDINDHLSTGRTISADIGIYKIIDFDANKSMKLFGTGSYGFGDFNRVFNQLGNSQIDLGIQRISFSTGLTFMPNKKINLNIGLTGKVFNFSDEGGFGDLPVDEIERFDRLIALSPSFLLDLNTRLEFGDDFAKFFFNWDYVLLNYENDDDLLTDFIANDVIHVGFNILINRAINKIKSKGHEKN